MDFSMESILPLIQEFGLKLIYAVLVIIIPRRGIYVMRGARCKWQFHTGPIFPVDHARAPATAAMVANPPLALWLG